MIDWSISLRFMFWSCAAQDWSMSACACGFLLTGFFGSRAAAVEARIKAIPMAAKIFVTRIYFSSFAPGSGMGRTMLMALKPSGIADISNTISPPETISRWRSQQPFNSLPLMVTRLV